MGIDAFMRSAGCDSVGFVKGEHTTNSFLQASNRVTSLGYRIGWVVGHPPPVAERDGGGVEGVRRMRVRGCWHVLVMSLSVAAATLYFNDVGVGPAVYLLWRHLALHLSSGLSCETRSGCTVVAVVVPRCSLGKDVILFVVTDVIRLFVCHLASRWKHFALKAP